MTSTLLNITQGWELWRRQAMEDDQPFAKHVFKLWDRKKPKSKLKVKRTLTPRSEMKKRLNCHEKKLGKAQCGVRVKNKNGNRFLDEIDKVRKGSERSGRWSTREGSSRDLLLDWGCTVAQNTAMTKRITFIHSSVFSSVSKHQIWFLSCKGRFAHSRWYCDAWGRRFKTHLLNSKRVLSLKRMVALCEDRKYNSNFTEEGIQSIAWDCFQGTNVQRNNRCASAYTLCLDSYWRKCLISAATMPRRSNPSKLTAEPRSLMSKLAKSKNEDLSKIHFVMS